MTENYDINFWFNQHELHSNVNGYGKEYYAYKIFEQVILPLQNIPDGYIVVMGTNRCVSFNLLCEHFGTERCIGFDLANPTRHTRVLIKNCLHLGDKDAIPIAFVHNDVGNFLLTPKAKIHAQMWAARHVVTGGYFLGRNNQNSAKINIESMMSDLGYTNTHLSCIDNQFLQNEIPRHHLYSHMLSVRQSCISKDNLSPVSINTSH